MQPYVLLKHATYLSDELFYTLLSTQPACRRWSEAVVWALTDLEIARRDMEYGVGSVARLYSATQRADGLLWIIYDEARQTA